MNTLILMIALVGAGDCNCPECQKAHKAVPAAVNCPRYAPRVGCYCKRCAGCGGQLCLSVTQPYFGSQPYNYRVNFDYPWSQRPTYPTGGFFPIVPDEGIEDIEELPIEVVEPPAEMLAPPLPLIDAQTKKTNKAAPASRVASTRRNTTRKLTIK